MQRIGAIVSGQLISLSIDFKRRSGDPIANPPGRASEILILVRFIAGDIIKPIDHICDFPTRIRDFDRSDCGATRNDFHHRPAVSF